MGPTVSPRPRGDTYHLTLVFLVVDNCPDTETHHCERRHVLRGSCIGFGDRINVFWVRDREFEFRPRDLEVNYY